MRVIFPIRAAVAASVCAMVAAACSQSPVAPSRTMAQPADDATMASLNPGVTARVANVSPEELAARGWNCQPAPAIPNRVTCSPPNQGHPVLLPGPPPPADRPATFSLLVFDSGVFVGTDLLIRSDLYHGQPCRWTGGLYRFLGRIGYYECLHPVNGG